MTEPVGRRAASKQATRAALFAAAQRLFAERGFEATTVRDIAATANVTERTFYRYFDGKEGLLAGEFESWLEILSTQIKTRPRTEAPFVAVQRAMLSIGEQAATGPGTGPPLWLFGDGGSLRVLRRTGPRPLLRLEGSISDSLLARTGGAVADPDEMFTAQVISRVAVAALRSALIRHRELRAASAGQAPSLAQLLSHAFAIIGEQVPDD
jgi:AcrR family transcriptional regulator